MKEKDRVPNIDIDRAIENQELFRNNPEIYTYLEPEDFEYEEN